jgi:ubiquinone/menaquinone biosynthesis C-methylase UbiE
VLPIILPGVFATMSTQNHQDTPPICDYTDSDYQSTFWDTGGRRYEDAVEAIALKRLLTKPGKLMLELGAGAGRNTPRYNMYEQIVLLDYSRTQLLQARERLGSNPNYRYVAADIYKLPFVDALFDGATMIRTLHHMADARQALSEVHRVQTNGGVFVLEFANKRNLKSILRYLLGRQKWSPFTTEQVEFVALNFNFHPKTVRKLLAEVGYELKDQLSVSHFRTGLLKRSLPHSLLVGADKLLQPTGRIWQVSPSIFTLSQAKNNAAASPGSFFQCPACHTSLPENDTSITCPGCQRIWQYEDGIYDFRIQPPEKNADV